MNEEALLFGKTMSLVGIVTDPVRGQEGDNIPAIVLLNAGLVHRVGPSRIYVKMARKLAAMGFVVLRFDFSGIGDSEVRYDNLPFEKSRVSEVQDAMDVLAETRGIDQFILMGICSGAVASLKTACCDPRVVGVTQINPQGYSYGQVSYAQGRSLLKEIISDPKYSLKKAIETRKYWGRADYLRLGSNLISAFTGKRKTVAAAREITADFRLLTQRGVRLLLVYSAGDPGLYYLDVILSDDSDGLSPSGKLRVEIIQQADHIYTPLRSQEDLLRVVQDWAHTMVQPDPVDQLGAIVL